MLYYNDDPQRQLVREHMQLLAHEIRRVRGPTALELCHPGWRRLGRSLLGRLRRSPRDNVLRAPAYPASK